MPSADASSAGPGAGFALPTVPHLLRRFVEESARVILLTGAAHARRRMPEPTTSGGVRFGPTDETNCACLEQCVLLTRRSRSAERFAKITPIGES